MGLLKLWLACLIISTLSGCGLFAPTIPDLDRPYSGFIKDYRSFHTVETQETEFVAAKAWIAPDQALNRYQTVIVDPVRIERGIQRDQQITHKAMKNIRQYMTSALTSKLDEYYQVSDQASGRTLRARVAITGLETRDESFRFYEFLPAAFAVTTAAKAIGTRDEEINMFVEAEFLDAETHEVVAKTLVSMVGHERLENKWEAVSLAKIKASIDQWITLQVAALKQAHQTTYVADNSPVQPKLVDQE